MHSSYLVSTTYSSVSAGGHKNDQLAYDWLKYYTIFPNKQAKKKTSKNLHGARSKINFALLI